MPKYYFDTNNGDSFVKDTEGIDLADHQAARKEAVVSLPGIASDCSTDGDRGAIITHVRDEAGKLIFVSTLTVTEEWIA